MGHSSFQDEDDDEDEYEEEGSGGNRLLGFMFGNVDNSGDLDADYLDEDAKEHLAAVADKLGPSLTDIDLSEKSPHTPADAADQDYDEKAENAIDYEDFDEEYDGPEIEAATEEDHLLPKKEYFTADVSSALEPKSSVFDDENYDEDEESEKEQEVVGGQEEHTVAFEVEKSPEDDVQCGSSDSEKQADGSEDFQEIAGVLEEPLDGKGSTPLPVLCVEDGMVILRFSEIFGIHEPLKKADKREHGYFTHREKYKSMDASDLVEEDEEVFLKGTGQGFSFIGWENAIQQDMPEFTDEPLVQGGLSMSAHNEEHIKDSYSSPEPMKEDIVVNISTGWQSPSSPRFFALDQQDWEEQILWDNSPAISGDSLESPEISVSELEASVARETIPQTAQNVLSEHSTKPYEKDHDSSLCSSSVFLEPFGLRNSSGSMDLSFLDRFHPQLLRLESPLGVDSSNDGDHKREYVTIEPDKSDVVRCFNQLTLQNKDMMEGSWLDNIIWEPHSVIAKPKLILDLQDKQMLFEIFDNKESKHLQLHAGAMIITRPVKPSSLGSSEVSGHKYHPGWQFNIANDKFYVNRKVSQQLQSNSNKRMAHGVRVHHSAPALKLQTMKLKLSNKDVANFHRPRAIWYPHDIEVGVRQQGRLPTQGPMKIILKSLGGKGSKLHVDAEETVSSVKAKASKKLDFKPSESVKIFYLGKELEDDKSLAAQNVQPNSLLHLIRTRIHLLPRAQKLPRENKSLRPPGAFKKKSDLSVRDGHIFLMEYCEERPLLLSNPGMGANLCTYYRKASSGDQTGGLLRNGNQTLGNVLLLEPADKSPFLGDIKAGCSQSSLETNMYKAPIVSHKVPSTDFLLVRSAKGKLSIRRIDKIAVVGQQEPLMEVISPGLKNLQTYLMNRMLVYVYREFSAAAKRGLTPFIGTDELVTHFPNLSDAIVRKKLKECAYLRRDKSGRQIWSMKPDFHIPPEGVLRKLVFPEHVCAYESMQAGLYRLKHLGITRLTHPTTISSAMSQLPDEAIALAAASHIERELQITPWNLSSNFVACTSQDRESIERLEITGVGDPSGRGLGFSYVRTAPKAPMSNAVMKKKAAAGRGGSSVTGTDADLRRLSMEAAREVRFSCKNFPIELLFLLDDDEQKKKKKKKNKAVAEDVGLTFGLQSRISIENVQRIKKASTVSKQIVGATQPNGSYSTNENIVKDSKDIESRMFKGNLSGKVKGMKKNGMSSTGPLTKVKILGDNVKVSELFSSLSLSLSLSLDGKTKSSSNISSSYAYVGQILEIRIHEVPALCILQLISLQVGLSNVLEQIVETLRDNTELSYLFLKPVSKKEAPDYLDIIKRPMDLSTIRDKVRRMEYKDREEFRHDVWQIAYNAHIYNDGRNPGIPPLADQLLELCDYLMDEYQQSLCEAEAGIEARDT
ncbi:transcription initiation factor TFIID subunit 1-like [Herrania umbratica]|uniref:Transcription initiation factor TFIID subunit 1 n=1 Tax=Herrania umbratica TaxID=108875 RepID=A0A6J1AUS0_9ROSI|nr:transcription initiation factor TFIID subunit 1-like [Herrania umbratica]